MRLLTLLISTTMACGPASANDRPGDRSRALDSIETTESVDRDRVAALREGAADVRARANELNDAWADATTEFDAAVADFQKARAVGTIASNTFDKSRQDYEDAAARFRTTAMIVIIAAASDAFGNEVCGNTMSTQRFRAKLRAEGINVEGLDVDHIWPRSLGGADDVRNYQLLDSSLNRSLGADVMTKFASEPLAVLRGLAVSAMDAIRCN